MKKIEIFDCGNSEKKIGLYVNDERMDFADDVYAALVNHYGLSACQIKKLESFVGSCAGPIVVPGLYWDENGEEQIGCKEFQWVSVYAYESEGIVYVEISPRISGERKTVYKIDAEKFAGIEDALEKINIMENNGESRSKFASRVFLGPRIY